MSRRTLNYAGTEFTLADDTHVGDFVELGEIRAQTRVGPIWFTTGPGIPVFIREEPTSEGEVL